MARIVICEPSDELRHLFERTVARLGHEATSCHVPTADCGRADAMLVDVDEEGIAGDAALVHAHAPELPVIVCSIYSRGERSDTLGAVAHLVKPFTRAELERAIGDALTGRKGTIVGCPTASAPTATSV